MKKKEKKKILEKKGAPKRKGKRKVKEAEVKERTSEKEIGIGRKKVRSKEVKRGKAPIKKKVSERKVVRKTEKEGERVGDKKVKREEPKNIKPKKKLIKKIEKIFFPPKKEKTKKKKPKFRREGLKGVKKREERWRKPRGIDSKKHVGKRGKGKVPKIGYKQSKEESGLVRGLRPKHVYNPSQLKGVLIEKEGIIISGGVGRKKRNEIIKRANELKIIILNPRKGEI